MKESVSEWLLVMHCSGRLQSLVLLGAVLAGSVWLLVWLQIAKHAGTSSPMVTAVIGAFVQYHWVPPLLVIFLTVVFACRIYDREKRRVLRW